MADDTDETQSVDDGGEQQAQDDKKVGKKDKTFTQADVDLIVNKAKLQARKEFSDYHDLKQKAEELDKLQEASRSTEDKLRTGFDRAVRERDEALTRAKNTLVRSSIISAASRLGCVDPEAVAALLPRDDLIIENDEVLGVEEAVKALLAKKPYLRSQGAQRAGAEMQGSVSEQQVFTRDQIRQWARTGGLTAERRKQIEEAAAAGRVR